MKVSKYASRPVCVCLQISGWSSVSRRVPRRRVDLDLDLTYTHMHPLQRRVTVPGEMHPGKDDVARGASLHVPSNVAVHGIRRINRVHEQSENGIQGVSPLPSNDTKGSRFRRRTVQTGGYHQN